MEPVDPQQQQLPVHQPEVDSPVGAGRVDPLWRPASSQVPPALLYAERVTGCASAFDAKINSQ